MTSALVIALSLAGFGLLVFGERMGLGPQLAAYGVMAVFTLAIVALALASTSARLARLVVGRERSSTLGLTALVTAVLLCGLLAQPSGPRLWLQGGSLIMGLLFGYFAAPLAIWRNFAADLALHGDRDPGAGTRGSLPVLMVCSLFLSLLMLFEQFPVAIDQLVAMTGIGHRSILITVLALVGLVLLLGGVFGIQRVAKALMVIAFFTAIIPAVLMLANRFFDRFDIDAVRHAQTSVLTAVSIRLDASLFREIWPALATGILLGIAINQPAIAIRHRGWRGMAMIFGLVMATIFAALAQTGQTLLQSVVGEGIIAAPPAQWPLFVFDETLRGWLTVCGTQPDDVAAATRACGQPGARAPLDAARFVFEPGLDAPALALSQGWPVILGFIWGLLIPLFGMAALAFLLHAAASNFAERILFRALHPKALRAWRLAMVRLSTMGLLLALYVADSYSLRLDPAFSRWVLAGLTGTAVTAILVYRVIQAMRALRTRRQQRANRQHPGNAPVPIGDAEQTPVRAA